MNYTMGQVIYYIRSKKNQVPTNEIFHSKISVSRKSDCLMGPTYHSRGPSLQRNSPPPHLPVGPYRVSLCVCSFIAIFDPSCCGVYLISWFICLLIWSIDTLWSDRDSHSTWIWMRWGRACKVQLNWLYVRSTGWCISRAGSYGTRTLSSISTSPWKVRPPLTRIMRSLV